MPNTTNHKRGPLVLLPFPFSDQSSVKLRPAVVLNPSYPSDDLLVVAVSSVPGTLRPGEFPLEFWREAGLIHPSFVRRAIASISNTLVRRFLGELRDADLAKVDAALRLWFGL